MTPLTQNILEFLELVGFDSAEDVNLEEAASKAAAKFGARVKANKRVGKRLTPSKYLKKYGSSWQNLKNETELEGEELVELLRSTLDSYVSKAEKDKKHLSGLIKSGKRGREYAQSLLHSTDFRDQEDGERQLSKMDKFDSGLKRTIQKRTRGIKLAKKKLASEEVIVEKKMTPKKEKKEERLARNITMKNRFRDLLSKREEKTSMSGIPHTSSGKGMFEEVIPAKGNKKDKRATTDHKELPTMPSGMNAGMRMMPEERTALIAHLKEELLSEISKDKILSAYKERYALATAHQTVGNKTEAKKNAKKALSHADAHDNYEANREKYAKHAAARAVIASRAKSDATKTKED